MKLEPVWEVCDARGSWVARARAGSRTPDEPKERARGYDLAMAYDEALAQRFRRLLPGGIALTEKRMFGGIAFLVSGNMAIAAGGRGGILVRVDPAKADRLLATSGARPMRMRGKDMRGWLRVDSDGIGTQRQLAKWVEIGTAFASSLPPKPPGTRAPHRSRSPLR